VGLFYALLQAGAGGKWDFSLQEFAMEFLMIFIAVCSIFVNLFKEEIRKYLFKQP